MIIKRSYEQKRALYLLEEKYKGLDYQDPLRSYAPALDKFPHKSFHETF